MAPLSNYGKNIWHFFGGPYSRAPQLPLPRRRPARRVPQDRRRCVRRSLGGGHAEQCGSGGVRDRPERLITPSATRPQHRRECAGSEHVLPSGSVFPLCVYGVASVRPPTARTCTRARMLRQYTCLCVCIASFSFACVPVFAYGHVRKHTIASALERL